MRLVARIALTLAGGLLVMLVLFVVTPRTEGRFFCCPVGWTVTPGGVDQATGEVRPAIVSVNDGASTAVKTYAIIEKDLTIIPYPVGFVAGSLLTLTAITIVSRRSRRIASVPVVPAA